MIGTRWSYWPFLYFILNFLHRPWSIHCNQATQRLVALDAASKFASDSPKSPYGVSMMEEGRLEGDIAKNRHALVVSVVQGRDVAVDRTPVRPPEKTSASRVWANRLWHRNRPVSKPTIKRPQRPMSRLGYKSTAESDIINAQDQKADVAPYPQMEKEDILASKLVKRLLLDVPDPKVKSALSQYKKSLVTDFEFFNTLRSIILSTEHDAVIRLDALKLVILKISPSEGTLRNSLRNLQKITNRVMLSACECSYFQIYFKEIVKKLSVHEELCEFAGMGHQILSDTMDLFWSTHLKTLIVAAENKKPRFWIKGHYTSALRSGTARIHHSIYSIQTGIVRLLIRRKVSYDLENNNPGLKVMPIVFQIEAGVIYNTAPKIKISSSQINAFQLLLNVLPRTDELSRQRIVLLLGYLAEDTIQISTKTKGIDQDLLMERCLNFKSMLENIINQEVVGSREHKTLAKFFLDSLEQRIKDRGSKE